MSAEPLQATKASVLLTHSYHLAHDVKQWRKMQPYPPLGTLYAATSLREAGLSVAVFDPMFADPMTGFAAALEQHQPKIVVIYEDDFNFVTKMCLTHMRELAFALAGLAQQHGCKVIAHGSDATDHPDAFLAHGVDYVLNGEAEHTLTSLCETLLQSGEPKALPGLVQGSRNTSATPPPHNPYWADLPLAARDLIDLAPYREAWVSAHGTFSTNVVASRGCPFRCNWCAKPISGSRFQLRPAEAVANELRQLKEQYGVEHIWFGDDVFALDRHWVEAFATAVEKRGRPLPFKVQSRADLLSNDTVAALKRAGCAEVWMGVESGSQKVLNTMTKGLSVEAVHEARRYLAAAGIRACFFLQLGYPGEGWSEICETIQLVRETRPDDIGVSVSYPLPGTVFYNRVQEQLGKKRNWADSDDLCAIHTAAYTDEFYQALRTALHAEVTAFHAIVPQRNVESLWERVHALEPVSRNTNVLTLSSSSATLFPVDDLIAVPRGV
jgi:anaerobic magnesium-protoporphyrin IX monomethyl ester cyclase